MYITQIVDCDLMLLEQHVNVPVQNKGVWDVTQFNLLGR